MKYRKITNQKSTVVHNNGQHRFMPTLKKKEKKNPKTNEQTKHQKHDLSALIYIMDGLFNLMIF